MTVTLEGYIQVPEDRLDDVRTALVEHIKLTRAEPGCLRFEIVASQTKMGRFDVSEEFLNKAAFEAHQARVKSSDWGRITQGIPRDYEISGL
ncbi:antibiotic biosynthesis monooxygenase [uncultured Pelagimonas sp.]|uniref:putative quinol monooxygenase n=1 Tax=uncultured Pelagimonas sp. TaxID=1618102 RepID=UPI0026319D55|nr:antibiotic biosynthesis monooxygenase [uncultured Pelagimonas sp.]